MISLVSPIHYVNVPNLNQTETYSATGKHLLGSVDESAASWASLAFWGLCEWFHFTSDNSLCFTGEERNSLRKPKSGQEFSCKLIGVKHQEINLKVSEKLNLSYDHQWEKVNEFPQDF